MKRGERNLFEQVRNAKVRDTQKSRRKRASFLRLGYSFENKHSVNHDEHQTSESNDRDSR